MDFESSQYEHVLSYQFGKCCCLLIGEIWVNDVNEALNPKQYLTKYPSPHIVVQGTFAIIG
jgi:hypothetical protein